jgi:hypothetical protein
MNKEIPQPIGQDFLEGMSFVAITMKYCIDPRTAKKIRPEQFSIGIAI